MYSEYRNDQQQQQQQRQQEEEVWLPAKELLNLLNIVNPPYPCRNVISTIVSDCFAMPMGVEIGFRFKNNINMARREELNGNAHKPVWKYSPHARDLLTDFLIKFPVVAGAIMAGEITEKDDPAENTNKYVYGIPEKVVNSITQWRLYHQNEIFEPAPMYHYYPDSRGELVEFNIHLYNPFTPSNYYKKQNSNYTKNIASTLSGKEVNNHKPPPQKPIQQKVSFIAPAQKENDNESDDHNEHEENTKNSRTSNTTIKKKSRKKKREKKN